MTAENTVSICSCVSPEQTDFDYLYFNHDILIIHIHTEREENHKSNFQRIWLCTRKIKI